MIQPTISINKLKHFQHYQNQYEVLALIIYLLINATILATSVIMENARHGLNSNLQVWEPFVWEYSSAFSLIFLFPGIIILLEKQPFQWQKIKRSLIIYLSASIIFSILHVSMMVFIRKIIYWSQSLTYDFGHVPFEFLYEYRKDLWSFILFIMLITSYQFIIKRLYGEANLIADGEDEKNPQSKERLLVKKLGKEFIIKVTDIEWLESSGNYVNLHVKGRIYPTRSTMNGIIKQIADKGFCRIHRSYAINLDMIDSITPLSSGDSEIKLVSGKVLNLSRRYKSDFKLRLN